MLQNPTDQVKGLALKLNDMFAIVQKIFTSNPGDVVYNKGLKLAKWGRGKKKKVWGGLH